MNQNNSSKFEYTYSAKERAELKRIREKYLSATTPLQADKMEQIKRLDAGVIKKASAWSICLGVAGALIMGSGMSLIMTDLQNTLQISPAFAITVGLLLGFVGMAGVIFSYPLHHFILKRERRKIAPRILQLSDELMKESR